MGKQLTQIARILKSYDKDGQLIISSNSIAELSEILLRNPIFIYFDGLSVPFFISSLELKAKNKALVKIVDINTLDLAEELCNRDIYIETSLISEEEDEEELCLEDLIDWALYDQNDREIGLISNVEAYDYNACICVKIADKEYLIPYNEDLIIDIDYQNKKLSMELAEGLLMDI